MKTTTGKFLRFFISALMICTFLLTIGQEPVISGSGTNITISGPITVTSAAEHQYTATGGVGPYTWSVQGTQGQLGMAIDQNGTLWADQTLACAAYTVTVTDSSGSTGSINIVSDAAEAVENLCSAPGFDPWHDWPLSCPMATTSTWMGTYSIINYFTLAECPGAPSNWVSPCGGPTSYSPCVGPIGYFGDGDCSPENGCVFVAEYGAKFLCTQFYAGNPTNPPTTPSSWPDSYLGPCTNSGYCDDPVNTATGNYTYQHQDLKLGGKNLGIEFIRNYNSQDVYKGPFGNGWTHSFNVFLRLWNTGAVGVKYEDGHEETFQLQTNGTFSPMWGGIYNQLVKNADGSYTLANKKQTRYLFASNGKLTSVVDKNGNVVSLNYTGGNLTTIVDPVGRTLALTYDSNNHISQVSDPMGRVLSYSYDPNGNLVSFTDALGGKWTYQYDSGNNLAGIIKPDGNTLVTDVYSNNKVVSQSDGLGQTSWFNYSNLTPSGTTTTITDHNGNAKIHTHDLLYRLLQDTDQLGNSINYTYDNNNNRIQVRDKNGNTTQYTFDSMGNVTSKTDALANVTNTTYDTRNNPMIRKDALGNQISFAYDSNSNLTSTTDQLGNVTSFTYNPFGEILSSKDANGHTSSFGYDSSGNLTGVKDPLGNSKTYGYDAAGRQVSATDADGHATSYGYDANDNLLSVTDALGNSTSFTYDPNGNKISSKDKNGNTTTYAYNANDRVVSVTGPLVNVTTYSYDPMGNKMSETDPLGHTTSYSYDAVGNLVIAYDPLGDKTSYTHDPNGNLTWISNPAGEGTAFSYDPLNRIVMVTDPWCYTTTKTYDALGRLVVNTDENGGSTQYTYDGTGRLIQVTEAGGQITAYAYDAVGNRTVMTDSVGNTTGYAYDAANRLTSETDAMQATKSYAYDGAGNVVGLQKPDGAMISYGYDGVNRLVQVSNPTGPPTSFAYDANGNRTAMQDNLGSSAWAYDAMNRMLSYTGPFGNGTGYAYDAKGNRTQIVYPGNHIVSYGYDTAGRLLSVSDWLGNATNYSYDAAGRPTLVTNPNGTTSSYAYGFGYRLSSLSNNQSDGTVINGYQYTLDGVGNQAGVTKQEPLAPAPTTLAVVYGYGADNRIETAGAATFTHDANGNRTAQYGNNAAIFTYDYLNRLATVTGSTNLQFGYDGLGRRLSRTINYAQTLYVIDPNGSLPNVIAETDTLGNVQDWYIYGLGLAYKLMPDGTTYIYHFDDRGSTIAMTEGTGQIVNEYSYGPHGERLGILEGTHNPFGYVGRYGVMEEGNGLKFMRARYYDDGSGRFLNKDLIPGVIRSPQSLNRYAYALNNPVNGIDPLGLIDPVILANAGQGLPVVLPNGQMIVDPYTGGNVMSPLPSLSDVAEAGRNTGFSYSQLLGSYADDFGPSSSASWLLGMLGTDLGHAGTYDYQRSGSLLDGYTQYPQFRDVSNVNVGLYCQQVGLTLGETLAIAGSFADFFASNASPSQPYGLDPRTAYFIQTGFGLGASGVFK